MKEMNTLDEEIELEQFSINDYITSHLQQVFLPWPLSALHLLPDWVILSGLIVIGLILTKIFFIKIKTPLNSKVGFSWLGNWQKDVSPIIFLNKFSHNTPCLVYYVMSTLKSPACLLPNHYDVHCGRYCLNETR